MITGCKEKTFINPMQGVWKLISTKPLLPDGNIDSSDGEWQMMKIVTAASFAFIEQEPGRARFEHGGTDTEHLYLGRYLLY
jgi:hypothetical protein